jgi:hypothetical protein
MSDFCALCGKPRDMVYAVDPEKPKPLCGACFGRWSPDKLDALLGVKQTRPYILPPAGVGNLLGGHAGPGPATGPASPSRVIVKEQG